jgi:adenylate kinase
MNIIIMGPQASGKGTQAERIAKKYGLNHINAGEILRTEVKKKTDLGRRAEDIMLRGELVPNELVDELIKENISEHMVFDGFPRSIEQAEFLNRHTIINAVIIIDITDEEAIRRISSRYVCGLCGKSYNILTNPPKQKDICDDDGSRLVQREDDNPKVVKQRLETYHEETSKVIDYYQARKTPLWTINGEQPIDEVFSDIVISIDDILK